MNKIVLTSLILMLLFAHTSALEMMNKKEYNDATKKMTAEFTSYLTDLGVFVPPKTHKIDIFFIKIFIIEAPEEKINSVVFLSLFFFYTLMSPVEFLGLLLLIPMLIIILFYLLLSKKEKTKKE